MPQPPTPIHRLGPADVARLRALNALFAEVFDDRETYAGAPPPDAWLAELLGKEHIVVLAALDGEAVIGGLVAYAFDKAERMRREIYIYDLAVAEAHRRRGVATALIAHLREIASACGAWVVFVQADPGDDPAIALYGKLGTREAVLHFDIAVGEGP
ncbi:AAC(3)-I family aminoglycoside N-acetyltransferase [Methylobacterium dankookense]|uniref:Gentamicin 3-N-acetyltransferase n=1 Tax=Methylobacterium dankookense TaxID=560405 RepID=A0A564FW37_9HYPH|nr:AAC(3)-I family aminoglycoside N-acetyltransferase [Methylobacterium dankookense]GJD57729.1 Gentamicin 3-N-acetyltransferase [Methylobacterium dankookense]VUF12359.1 Gentamicin 3-N-acetyltransferase [Methylobacterium dankookense]